MATNRFPRRGEVFTGAEIYELPLRDSPHLSVPVVHDPEVPFEYAPIQDTHITHDELLAVPGFAESQWRFIRETDEWIPVFDFIGNAEEALAFCDVTKVWSSTWDRYEWWIVPKGHPRDPYK